MNLIKCENAHFFDADKFVSCPHCANEAAGVTLADLTGSRQQEIDTASPEEPAGISKPKTTGWLVCTEGAARGESFTLREGENHIGRASHMDIRLSREPSVSRENHAVITFTPEDSSFFLSSTEHPDTVWLNGTPLVNAAALHSGDRITLGTCTLMFVPLCGGSFSWEEK